MLLIIWLLGIIGKIATRGLLRERVFAASIYAAWASRLVY
jgi:hypothetical protein